jgi:hypothetical protein
VTNSFVFLLILFWGSFSRAKSSESELPQLNISQLWIEALQFFENDGDNQSLQALIDKSLLTRSSDLALMSKIFEYHLRKKDRVSLTETFRRVVDENKCRGAQPPTSEAFCDQLKLLWKDNLDSVLFFESSAGKIEKARRFLEKKECTEAGALLRDVESREGAFARLRDMLREVALCVNDPGAALTIEAELQKIRFFTSKDAP